MNAHRHDSLKPYKLAFQGWVVVVLALYWNLPIAVSWFLSGPISFVFLAQSTTFLLLFICLRFAPSVRERIFTRGLSDSQTQAYSTFGILASSVVSIAAIVAFMLLG